MKIVGVLLIFLAVYLGWRFVVRGDALVFVSQSAEKEVSAVLKAVSENRELVLEIDNPARETRITEVSVDRALAARLGLSPPIGFKEESLPLSETEKNDKEMVQFVESFNKETARWVGSLTVPQNTKAQLVIPATSTTGISGVLSLKYETKLTIGGSISALRVSLTAPQPKAHGA